MGTAGGLSGVRVRPATIDDVTRIGEIHVASSREAYTGLLPAEQLDRLDAGERAAMWRRALASGTTRGMAIAEADGAIVGFAACGKQRTSDLVEAGYSGEITVMYVLRAAHGRGAGRLLMQAMARRLIAEGDRAMALWVLTANAPARRFYERLSGTVIAEKIEDGNEEVAYGWRDLKALVQNPSPRT